MRGERSWLLVFCLLSLGVHVALALGSVTFLTPVGSAGPATQIEVFLEPIAEPAAPKPQPQVKPRSPAAEATKRKYPFAKGRRHIGSPRNLGAADIMGAPSTAIGSPSERSVATAIVSPGGGSPAPGVVLGGQGGAPGPPAPPEDILFSGGGAGGAQLPVAAPRLGGGGGLSVLTTENPLAKETVPEEKPGLGPGLNGGQGTGSGGGVGFVRDRGIGTLPQGTEAVATLQSAPGEGIGAGAGDNIGTRPPGGGVGTGSLLPGTGGAGLGYGRGSGNGVGNGGGIGGGGGPGEGAAAPRAGRGGLFGVPPVSGGAVDGPVRIVYVLDISLSMEEGAKFATAQRELKQALRSLKPTDSFNIITFHGLMYVLASALLPATEENVQRGIAFVDALELGEGTNLSQALERALALEGITQVLVLSDGEPTDGIQDRDLLRDLVRARNRQKAQIYTFALGRGNRFPGMALLRALAEDNNGTFRPIDLAKKP